MKSKLSRYFIKFYEKLWCLFAVNYWMQLYADDPYSKSFDMWVRQSLKEGHKLEIISDHKAKFNGRVLWIANSPYGAFCLSERGKPSVSPSRYTKYLMNKQIKRINKEKLTKDIENWR